MVLQILVIGFFWASGAIGLRWGLRLRRGEGNLPSGQWGRKNAVSLLWADPDRNILVGSIFGLGCAALMTSLGIFMAIPFGSLSTVIVAVGAAAFAGAGLLWLCLAIFDRPQALLPPSLRKQTPRKGVVDARKLPRKRNRTARSPKGARKK